ncbi:MAG: hypothetical protein CFE33_13220 [Pseudorhodobacter sp. PARRP1]|nr:MAG: hypothetical protein CFE33_13220 [Pseudorhodobacter sp. PARRP1]
MPADLQIESLMNAIHQALLGADYPTLGELSPQLDAALLDLPQPMDPKILARLQRLADRNARSAGAAAKGVRAAIQRMKDVRQIASGMITYDENGQRAAPSGQRTLSQRL